jgi:hypothetical protein
VCFTSNLQNAVSVDAIWISKVLTVGNNSFQIIVSMIGYSGSKSQMKILSEQKWVSTWKMSTINQPQLLIVSGYLNNNILMEVLRDTALQVFVSLPFIT